MVVENDPDIRDSLATGLFDEGYDVIAAVNGRDALDRLELGAQPEVILLAVPRKPLNLDLLLDLVQGAIEQGGAPPASAAS